jgi:hypothetical protein
MLTNPKLIVTVFVDTTQSDDYYAALLQDSLLNLTTKYLGKIIHVIFEDEISDQERNIERTQIIEMWNSECNYQVEFNSSNYAFFAFSQRKQQFFICLQVEQDILTESQLLELTRELDSLLHIRTLSIEAAQLSNRTHANLNALSAEDYDPLNYHYAARVGLINLYPAKEQRDLFFLPLPDDFYLHIPAKHIETSNKGSIIVVNYDKTASEIEITESVRKIIDYLRAELSKLSVWGEIKWTPKWREVYGTLLASKGMTLN